ncbi:AMP-binding protein [Hamadaea tsunoensis]|uniref:AMP-binding protein n=1 Tax=Hamadaea tsunoensis TaxID=53368 RepID=UPI00041893FC|nr:AMP-binding protein [Hamadaea tsunoensis]
MATLHSRFLRGLALAPDAAAVRSGPDEITYAEAHATALLWAGALARTKATAVGVLAGKSVDAYVGTLAALYSGATVVPLRPDFPAGRTAAMIEAAGVGAIVADGKGLAALPPLPGMPVLAPGRTIAGHVTALYADPAEALSEPAYAEPDSPAYVLFTSGSTGRPKGVVLTHRGYDHYFGLLDERYDFGPGDVFSQTFDLNFDCALFDMFAAWGSGATVVPVPLAAYRDLPGFAASTGMSVWFSTPSAVELVRRLGGLAPGSLPGLRWSFFAGEAFTCRDAEDWQRAAANSTVENLYGPTEATTTVAAYRCTAQTREHAVNGVVPIGDVHAGHDWLLRDEDAAGEGELCIAGPQLCAGYLDPADEEGRFLSHGGQRFYRTGDRVRRTPAGLAYLGRLDFQVQVQGVRVELSEVEHAMRACGVHDAVVVGVPDGPSTALYAFYTGDPRTPVELLRGLRPLLPDAVIPKHFRHLAEFPVNANRKIDRGALGVLALEEPQHGGA